MFYYTILYYITLYYAILCYIILYYIVVYYYIVLYYIICLIPIISPYYITILYHHSISPYYITILYYINMYIYTYTVYSISERIFYYNILLIHLASCPIPSFPCFFSAPDLLLECLYTAARSSSAVNFCRWMAGLMGD